MSVDSLYWRGSHLYPRMKLVPFIPRMLEKEAHPIVPNVNRIIVRASDEMRFSPIPFDLSGRS